MSGFRISGSISGSIIIISGRICGRISGSISGRISGRVFPPMGSPHWGVQGGFSDFSQRITFFLTFAHTPLPCKN
jgi:hypothetical protein